MTVAVMVKVFDGIVLAADSATTVPLDNGSAQVYNNADKVFELHRKLPVGAMTWGRGSVGSASIATLIKDLRRRLMGRDPDYAGWALGRDGYSVHDVAARAAELVNGLLETERTAREEQDPDGGDAERDEPATAVLGLLIAGFSHGSKQSEAWLLEFDGVAPAVPREFAGTAVYGWASFAQPEATTRLFYGADPALGPLLASNLAASVGPEDAAGVVEVATAAIAALRKEPVMPAMPFPDAVALARYMVDVTVGYTHFLLGPDTVGGPVDVAGLSRHEGFKWITRKHYYSPDLNRRDTGHA